jgi:hypothetical protein
MLLSYRFTSLPSQLYRNDPFLIHGRIAAQKQFRVESKNNPRIFLQQEGIGKRGAEDPPYLVCLKN